MLIVLAFIHQWIEKYSYVYQITMLLTGIGSILGLLPGLGLDYQWLHYIPLFDQSLGWIVFAVLGFLLAIVFSKKEN